MFQCVTLHVAADGSSKSNGLDVANRDETARKTLHLARKSLLSWCCTDYGPRWSAARKRRKNNDATDPRSGAGSPNYRSALGPIEEQESIPTWLNTMRCLLFIEEYNSYLMGKFLDPNQSGLEEAKAITEEQERIKACCLYGADIDDNMIRIVLDAFTRQKGKFPAEMALQLLEHLFESCGRGRGTSLRVSDPELVWEIYSLAQYSPPPHLFDGKEPAGARMKEKISSCGSEGDKIPRLALPGFWWRATMLGLVMCGASPHDIGEVLFRDHPTLRALIKMVTSVRYRFPTVDCDQVTKEAMKAAESESREAETEIAEFLFLPPKRKKGSKAGHASGPRVSRRIKKQQEEKVAAADLAETNKRKKLLKSAQKSIMLWDPDGPARKPPKDSADLLLAVEKMFDLSTSFQQCTTPDFLLLTIGDTTRGAIERAYNWLIPVISEIPEIISRLPSSASCFLLLRAYGADLGDKTQLKLLSAPLLSHVSESLQGKNGEDDCLRAFDLLMSDVASHNAERRKSARRVLQDSLGQMEGPPEVSASSTWMANILRVKYASKLVKSSIQHLSKAATFERGKVLKSIVLALQDQLQFATDNKIDKGLSFPYLLSNLISQRQSVFAEAIDTFPDLRNLAVGVVYSEITKVGQITDAPSEVFGGQRALVWLELGGTQREARVPLALLHSSCVLLSICCTGDGEDSKQKKGWPDAVKDLVKILLNPSDLSGASADGPTLGLAGARHAINANELAVPVESWILLCKARDDAVGKKAALSAPEEFLARLLLSSGLPRASLVAMVGRLGTLGDSAKDKDAVFRELLLPSMSSEWDLGRVGKHGDIIRKLLGRLSAYFRVGLGDDGFSKSFLKWLVQASKLPREHVTRPKKKRKVSPKSPFVKLNDAPNLLRLTGPMDVEADQEADLDIHNDLESLSFLSVGQREETTHGTESIEAKISHFLAENNAAGLNHLLAQKVSGIEGELGSHTASFLLQCVEDHSPKHTWMFDTLLRWVPISLQHECKPETMDFLFSSSGRERKVPQNILDGIVQTCFLLWAPSCWKSCTDWALSINEEDVTRYSLSRLVSFLQASLGDQPSCRNLSEEESIVLCRIAILCLEMDGEREGIPSGRNNLPASLTLLLDFAGQGKRHFTLAGKMLLQRLDKSTPVPQSLLSSAFMRLYLLRPQWASTATAQVRKVLLKSAEENHSIWTSWISSSDGQMDDLLECLQSGDSRVLRSFNEQARKYPLLILRKCGNFEAILKKDARPLAQTHSSQSQRVEGTTVGGKIEASIEGHVVRLSLLDWGYQFTESIWMGVLDTFCSIHKEVLYFSGEKELRRILECVLLLLQVQTNLTTASSATKIKGKASEIVQNYKAANLSGFNRWLSQSLEGTEVRNGLVGCSLISPQDAIDSLKAVA
mmetsp:Transcript_22685/g.53527  ORF Transcript_22685/g.53527 Transcript_22685/m.53527 type:complete len:1400 (+) Transcript_22685:3-4202(+)